jgi:hypothetical protein
MGLFLAALKVVVCFQQSPNPVKKKKTIWHFFLPVNQALNQAEKLPKCNG